MVLPMGLALPGDIQGNTISRVVLFLYTPFTTFTVHKALLRKALSPYWSYSMGNKVGTYGALNVCKVMLCG